ncbi:hypothetical protein HA466_0192650 [Hirschfeldia incana]|nr:hypothetical protein HA466_0192650 [Hirschfeldia incana]
MGSKRMRVQTSPMSEMDATDEMHEALFAKRGCCFLMPCLASSSRPSSRGRSVWWQRIRTGDKLEPEERWWIRGWRKMRQWSEVVAGPRWKTFIRRFGRNHCCCGGGSNGGGCVAAISPNRSEQGKFRYDPLSYSLNFDDGKQTGRFEDEFPYRYYSKRFTAPSLPVSTKCPIDFDSDREAQALHK